MYTNCYCPQIYNAPNLLVLSPNQEVQQYDFTMDSPFMVSAQNGVPQVLLQMSMWEEETGSYNPVLTQILTSNEMYSNAQKVFQSGRYSLTLNCSEKPYTGCSATVWLTAANVQYY